MEHPQVAVKEMEAAAIAWVCGLYQKPLICVKAITDIVDGGRSVVDGGRSVVDGGGQFGQKEEKTT